MEKNLKEEWVQKSETGNRKDALTTGKKKTTHVFFGKPTN